MKKENNNNQDVVLWCGAVITYEGLKKYKGEAPAASPWIKGFISGIQSQGFKVKIFATIWDSLFPKGELLPGNRKYLDSNFDQISVRYLNIPFLRNYSIKKSLERNIIKTIKKGNKPLAILNYNTYPYYCNAIKSVLKKFPEIAWFNVVLDLDDPIPDNWVNFKNDTEGAKGAIFLSWWGFENAPVKDKLHLDCGWSGKLPEYKFSTKKTFVHAGKMTAYGGIDSLIEAIKLVKSEDVIFKFYGKGSYKKLEDLAKNDKRVQICGFVNDEELVRNCESAYGFLSPRETNYQGTRMIFPSKILFYLKFQKPIISMMLPGMSPEYDKVLVKPSENSSVEWAKIINDSLEFSEHKLMAIKESSLEILNRKTWDNQGKSLLNFIKKTLDKE